MGFYESMGLSPLINASETYTGLGGSLMDEETLRAMCEAGRGFVDMAALTDRVCDRAAQLTRNEAAFVTTGASAGLALSAIACMCGMDERQHDMVPDASGFQKNEIIVFDGAFRGLIPYWRLIGLTGARIVAVEPTIEAAIAAHRESTAAIFLFPGALYEADVPNCEEAIPAFKRAGMTVVVDAAAQLPPASNLWHYTTELGADLCIFSGGKHIKGPQSTGLIVGKRALIDACRLSACPNARIGRAYKTGKEELAGFITALGRFVAEPEEARYRRQMDILSEIDRYLTANAPVTTQFSREGRLGTHQPLLFVTMPPGKRAADLNAYTRSLHPPIDVGVYGPEFGRPENLLFLNAYNLTGDQAQVVAKAVCDFVNQ